MKKYSFKIEFENGVAKDLEIAGYGFIGMRLSNPYLRKNKKVQKVLVFYLP